MSLSTGQLQSLKQNLESAISTARGKPYLFTSITMDRLDAEDGHFTIAGNYQSGLGDIERGTYEATIDAGFKIVRLIMHQKA